MSAKVMSLTHTQEMGRLFPFPYGKLPFMLKLGEVIDLKHSLAHHYRFERAISRYQYSPQHRWLYIITSAHCFLCPF